MKLNVIITKWTRITCIRSTYNIIISLFYVFWINLCIISRNKEIFRTIVAYLNIVFYICYFKLKHTIKNMIYNHYNEPQLKEVNMGNEFSMDTYCSIITAYVHMTLKKKIYFSPIVLVKDEDLDAFEEHVRKYVM